MKSSSRAGRFKKKLVLEHALAQESQEVEAKMAPILEHYRSGRFMPPEVVGSYILLVLSLRYPKQWLGAKRSKPLEIPHQLDLSLKDLPWELESNVQRRLEPWKTVGEVFAHFALKSTPESVNRSLLSWSANLYYLELMFRIPTPREVLEQQKYGRRCVTLLPQRIDKYVLNERDPLSFTMHDLIHADHFYRQHEVFQGQLGFYGLLDFCIRENHFEEHLQIKKFQDEFEYLISDMNAYAIHLMKCFKAALIHYHTSGEEFFHKWVARISDSEDVTKALLRLNHKDYDPYQDDAVILSFLARWIAQENTSDQRNRC